MGSLKKQTERATHTHRENEERETGEKHKRGGRKRGIESGVWCGGGLRSEKLGPS